MIIDHFGAAFARDTGFDLSFMRLIGRMAFPLYAFLIAVGCDKTRDIKKYIMRLFAFALVSHVPFAIFIGVVNGTGTEIFSLAHLNVFFTLACGALSIWIYQLTFRKDKIAWILAIAALAAACEFLNTDYGAIGVIYIAAIYIAGEERKQAVVMAAGAIAIYIGHLLQGPGHIQFYSAFAAMAASLLVLVYNGEKGPSAKYLFYGMYPVHLLLISGIYFLLYIK